MEAVRRRGRQRTESGDAAGNKKKMYKEEPERRENMAGRREKKDEGEESSLRSGMRAKGSAKTETARCATASSVERTQGLPATSAEGSFTPSLCFFFVDFFQLFETAYGDRSPLLRTLLHETRARALARANVRRILSRMAEEDFTSISRGNLRLRTHK